MTFLIQQTLIYAVPLMIVALAGVFAERSGIINLALEGIMIFGAFIGVLFVRTMQGSEVFAAAKAAGDYATLQGLEIMAMVVAALLGAIFSLLNVIQTVPSVALFGLLIAPLAALVTAFPWLGKLGIAGTGMTPALIALVLYALLPLVRGVVVGLNQIPRDVLESARAMGMSGAQRFLHVQLPLALPVFLRSLRVVMVQTVGMAVIAALIGAGGFGALVFQGLLSSAIDLVLLGVIPVIVLAVLTDALFDLLIALLKVKRND